MNLNTPLKRQLVGILAANREDAYATQRKRSGILCAVARLLHERFGLQKWDNLREKHVRLVIEQWKADDTGRRSIEEKLSHLRWLVRKIGKANLVPRTNRELGIEPGPRHTRAGKIIPNTLFAEIRAKLTDERLRTAFLLARNLGLRFREAMLFRPWQDWDGDQRVWVKRGSKGGRPRYLYIHDAKQREVLQLARLLTSGDGGLIPPEYETFEKWRQHCYRQLRAAGVGRSTDVLFHDARRTYAVERMDGLGDNGVDELRAADLVAREMGHCRREILDWYIAEAGEDAA